MHLIVPFAGSVSEAGRQALQSLSLPSLTRLLGRLAPGEALGSDEFSPNPPHEQALARALGWPHAPDAALPFAALQAAALGLPAAEHGWGRLTPVHLHVGSDAVSLTDPAALQLAEAESRALLDALRPLFETEGFTLHWAAPMDWLAAHPLLDGLVTASLDRVVGRNIDPWLPGQRSARLVRRLQNEVQMLLHTHPINQAREAAGLPSVNSFWLSGCGRLSGAAAPDMVQVDDRLRDAALAEDWAAWCEAWQALDAGPIAGLLRASGPLSLTLCGERHARTWAPAASGLWQRLAASWRRPSVHAVLEAL
ncbi:MAG: hypothetical protein JNL87_17125 [Burkholderiaceae bacterium]|nr:hypothetical protein [Burkholderiaceae bacterium]